MKHLTRIIIIINIALIVLLAITLVQFWLNTPGRFCNRDYTANSPSYIIYRCRGETDYVPRNQ